MVISSLIPTALIVILPFPLRVSVCLCVCMRVRWSLGDCCEHTYNGTALYWNGWRTNHSATIIADRCLLMANISVKRIGSTSRIWSRNDFGPTIWPTLWPCNGVYQSSGCSVEPSVHKRRADDLRNSEDRCFEMRAETRMQKKVEQQKDRDNK